ncbi:conjugal transfer protein TraA [Enterococcus faecalis]|nr:conjugal transfer protein TraA [Enterococcus faecalis]
MHFFAPWKEYFKMFLYELFKEQRKLYNFTQEEFYEGIFKKRAASSFEVHNTHDLKVKDLPVLSDRSMMSILEIIHYAKEEFISPYDEDLNSLFDIFQNNTEKENKDYIYKLYKKSIELKEHSIIYWNLYLIIKIQCSEYDSRIVPTDSQDLSELKKMILSKQKFTLYDYKIVTNLSLVFSYKELQPFLSSLFPLDSNAPTVTSEAAYYLLENITTKLVQNRDFESCTEVLNIYNDLLQKFPSYKYKLNYLITYNLVGYFFTNNMDSLNNSIKYVDLLGDLENVELAKLMKDNIYLMISKKNNGSMSKPETLLTKENNHIKLNEKKITKRLE